MRNLMIGFVVLFSAAFTQTSAQNLNMTLLGNLDYQTLHGSDISDVWGHALSGGQEYALLGVNDPGGFSIVDVTNPSSPNEVFFEPGSNSIWRDIKVWNNHAYVTTEGGGGLLIVDMSPLPAPITNFTYFDFCQPSDDNSAHNLYIDENGRCYIFGADCGNGGAMMFDLTQNPMAPVFEGYFDTWYIHDGMARGDTLYASHVNDGFFTIVDVSNPVSPVVLGSQNTSSDFTHNAWVSDDGDYLYTTDEVSGAWLDAYDISDPTDIKPLDKIQSNPGSGVIPHNTHFMNEYLITSYYRDGVTIHDVSNPDNMVEVGNYDTSPLVGDGFNGSWGVYPWLPSGNIITTDIELGLFILGPTYVRGCYLEGNVTEQGSGTALNGVDIEIITSTVSDFTDINGDYKMGIGTAGTYNVAYSKFGYIPDTAYNVTLSNGNVTIQDMQLVALVPFNITGQITETGGNPIQNAEVIVSNDMVSYSAITDAAGNFTITGVIEDNYNYIVGHWGHWTTCGTDFYDAQNNTINEELIIGYYDDFSMDFGWTTSGNASSGDWEREDPNGTWFGGGNQSNPEDDNQTDCLDQAFCTGNGGGNAGSDDVDDGAVELMSPVFDATQGSNPTIHFSRWFFNAGGQNTPDDSLIVYITDGTTEVVLDQVVPGNPDASGGWNDVSVAVSSVITPSATMQLRIHTADYQGSGNLCEAAFDKFFMTYASGIEGADAEQFTLNAMPNPFNDFVTINWGQTSINKTVNVQLFDIAGKLVYTAGVNASNGQVQINRSLPAGVYIVNVDGLNTKPLRIVRR